MRRGRWSLGTGFLLVLLCLLLSSVTFGVTVSVSEFVLLAENEDPIDVSFIIHNGDSQAIAFEVRVIDWTLENERLLTMDPGTIDRSCAAWITTQVQASRLEPGQESKVGIRVEPDLSRPGAFWCGLLVRVRAPEDSGGTGITALREFLVKLLVTASSADLRARVLAVTPFGMNPVWAVAEFENTGNAFLQDVQGWMVLEDQGGQELARLALERFDSLPGTTTRLSAAWPWALQTSGIYLLRAVFDLGREQHLAGETAFRIPELELEPVPGAVHAPTDLDSDGLYEDIDGDGALGMADIDALTVYIDHVALQRNARAFDFNNDGTLNLSDVPILYDIVSQAEI